MPPKSEIRNTALSFALIVEGGPGITARPLREEAIDDEAGTQAALALLASGDICTTNVRAGVDQQAALCGDDVMRLCMSAIPECGRIASCINAQRASFRPGCKTVFDVSMAAG